MIVPLSLKTTKRTQMIDLTEEVSRIVSKSNLQQGLCNIYVSHATAAIIINENYDPKVCEDILDYLSKSIPRGIWKHDSVDGNADAHIKAGLLGPSETIPIKNKKLLLGTWQGIALVELDGPRQRKVFVSLIG